MTYEGSVRERALSIVEKARKLTVHDLRDLTRRIGSSPDLIGATRLDHYPECYGSGNVSCCEAADHASHDERLEERSALATTAIAPGLISTASPARSPAE